MPIVSGDEDILDRGAVVDLFVGVSTHRRVVLHRNGFAIPPRVLVRAQIDTGSSFSVIRPDVLRLKLDIKPFDKINAHAVTVDVDRVESIEQYTVSLSLTAEQTEMLIQDVAVLGAYFGPAGDIEALIGRDVLDHCLFVYDGPRRIFSLAF